MDGLHLTADLRDCAPHRPAMTDVAALRRFPGAEPPGVRSSEAGGITGVVLLAESHLAVHTWPELGAVTLDVYVCNHGADNTARAHVLLAHLLDGFGAAHVERHERQVARVAGHVA